MHNSAPPAFHHSRSENHLSSLLWTHSNISTSSLCSQSQETTSLFTLNPAAVCLVFHGSSCKRASTAGMKLVTFVGSEYRRLTSEGWGAVKGWWADSSSVEFSALGRKRGKSTTQRKWKAVGSRSASPAASRRLALNNRKAPRAEHCKREGRDETGWFHHQGIHSNTHQTKSVPWRKHHRQHQLECIAPLNTLASYPEMYHLPAEAAAAPGFDRDQVRSLEVHVFPATSSSEFSQTNLQLHTCGLTGGPHVRSTLCRHRNEGTEENVGYWAKCDTL